MPKAGRFLGVPDGYVIFSTALRFSVVILPHLLTLVKNRGFDIQNREM